jgi:hypothetical protein
MNLWVSSLVEWLVKIDQKVIRAGSIQDTPESIQALCARLSIPLPPDALAHFSEAGLVTVLDLLAWDPAGTFRWDVDVLLDCPCLRPLRLHPPPVAKSVLWPGQCWATINPLFSRTDGYVLEFLGHAEDGEVYIRVWKSDLAITTRSTLGSKVLLPPHSFARGAGTRHCLPFAELWGDSAPLKITLGGDVHSSRGLHRLIISVSPFPAPSSDSRKAIAHPWLSEWVLNNAQELRECDMFTDGACTRHSSLASRLFNDDSSATSGSVVMIDRGSKNEHGFMLHITDGESAGVCSAPAMELLAAAAACTIRDILYKAQHGQPIHIFSDSRGTVLRLQDCGRSALRRLVSKRNGALLYSLFRKRRGNIGTTHHVYSHPERRKSREQFTPIEYGNMLAHEAASPLAPTRVFPGFARFSISAEALLRDLLCPGQWYIGNSAGTPLLTPASDLMTSELTADYLRQRDDLRQSATPPRPPFWATASLRYAAKQFDCSTRRTFAQQTRITKLIYDKYFHGENRVKGCNIPERKEELISCTLCGDYDSEEHGLCHCQGPRGENLLQPVRSALFRDLSSMINSLPHCATRSFLNAYRDLANDAPHPHRIWKGCFSLPQRQHLLSILSAPISAGEEIKLLRLVKQVKSLFATALLRIRTQLTSYAFPHMRGASLLRPTASQVADIATFRNQPRITSMFGAVEVTPGHRKQCLREAAAPGPRFRLHSHPVRQALITLDSPDPPVRPSKSVWDPPSPSPSPCLTPDVDSVSCHRRPVRRIIVSPESSIKALQPLSKTLSLYRPPASLPSPPISDSDDWWLSPHAQAYSASLPVNVHPFQTPPPGGGLSSTSSLCRPALSDPLGLFYETLPSDLPPPEPP